LNLRVSANGLSESFPNHDVPGNQGSKFAAGRVRLFGDVISNGVIVLRQRIEPM